MKDMLSKIENRFLEILDKEVRLPVKIRAVEAFQEYLQGSKGQMRRSMLMGMLLRGLGKTDVSVSAQAIEIAAIGEMIHMASLLHDDVIDSAETRRLQPTFHALYGNKNAILFGDTLLAVALEKLGSLEDSDFFLPLFIQAVKGLAMGEILQYEWEGKIAIPLETYEQIIIGKTGDLFAAFAASAAFLALASAQESESFHQFGNRFGRFYQLRDDILDCFLVESGKDKKNDFMNRHATYPLVLLFPCLSKQEQRQLQDYWGKPDQYGRLLDLLCKYDIYEKVRLRLSQDLDSLMDFLREKMERPIFLQLQSYLQELRLPKRLPKFEAKQ